jgi:hypothetical protein
LQPRAISLDRGGVAKLRAHSSSRESSASLRASSQANFSTCIFRVTPSASGMSATRLSKGGGRRWPQVIGALCAGVMKAGSSMLWPVGLRRASGR